MSVKDLGQIPSIEGHTVSDDIFKIPARKCLRCGGLLTSAKAIRDGYGHTCKMKVQQEKINREELKNQFSLFGGDTDGE